MTAHLKSYILIARLCYYECHWPQLLCAEYQSPDKSKGSCMKKQSLVRIYGQVMYVSIDRLVGVA